MADKTDKTNNITWTNGYISAESFVRTWQTSDSIVDFQRKTARVLKEKGWLQLDVDRAKEKVVAATLRLQAVVGKDSKSSCLDEEDIAAINGTEYKPYSWDTGRLVDFDSRVVELRRNLDLASRRLEKAQRILDNPDDVAYYAGNYHEVPSANALWARAKRYRMKGVKLQYLSYNNEPPARCKWEVLAELAEELAA